MQKKCKWWKTEGWILSLTHPKPTVWIHRVSCKIIFQRSVTAWSTELWHLQSVCVFLLAVSTPCTHVFAVFRPVPCKTAQHAALWTLQCRQQLTARPAASHVNTCLSLLSPLTVARLSRHTRKSAGGEEARVGVINRRTSVTEWEKVQGWC